MGKHLLPNELSLCNDVFTSPDVNLTTKATLLTAFFMLNHNEEETAWWNEAIQHRQAIFPESCQFIFNAAHIDPSDCLMAYAYRLLRHEDLSYQEMTELMGAILDTSQEEYKKSDVFRRVAVKARNLSRKFSMSRFL